MRNYHYKSGLGILGVLALAGAAFAAPPQIVEISPASGTKNVEVATTAIVVKFDQPMGKGMSWTGGGPHFPKINESAKIGWQSDTVCVLPVELEAAKVYRVGINSPSFGNFQSASGEPVSETAIFFATKGASADDVAMMEPPKVTKFEPANGATDVDSSIKSISVTFDQPMGGGMSWTGGGPNYPGGGDKKPEWSADKRTCTKQVSLKPGTDYELGINSPSFRNFTNELGVPVKPVIYKFHTK